MTKNNLKKSTLRNSNSKIDPFKANKEKLAKKKNTSQASAKQYKELTGRKASEAPRTARGKANLVPTDQSIRLNKFIADAGIASRRKADEIITSGVVKVNGIVVTDLSTKVIKSDFVTVNGDPIAFEKNLIYIVLNKPKDTITTTKDEKGRKTVLDIVRKHTRVYPVGRLDRNTTGAILITNDGELANRLTHPKYEIIREYNATLDKELKMEDARQIANGVELEDGTTGTCNLFVFPEDKTKVKLHIFEGKNREVRRIFEHFGYEVKKLDRKMFAGISTKGLNRSAYRHLEREEVRMLKKLVGLA